MNACQALLGYNSAFFNVGSVAAGGGVWDELIYQSWSIPGEINTAIGLDAQGNVGTDADATIATVTMTAKSQEGPTKLVFLPDVSDVKATFLSDMSAQPVWPSKVDSTDVIIDGTVPTIVCPPDVTVSADAGLCYATGVALGTPTTFDTYGVQSVVNNAPTSFPVGQTVVTWTVTDNAGNTATCDQTVTVVDDPPAVAVISAKQGVLELLGSGAPNAVVGTVDIYITANDLCGLTGAATVTVTPFGGSPEAATLVGPGPGGSYQYQWAIVSGTPNGVATITASASDLAATTTVTATFNINMHEITGTVQLEALNPGSGGIVRSVTFVANGGAKSWTVPVSFAAGSSTGTFLLTDVPASTTSLSAKTAWNLRRKLTITYSGDRAVADFTGASKLLGGDINGTNSVNVLDYSVLKSRWLTADAGADVTGDGSVNLVDYAIMKANWFVVGDSQ